MLKVTVCIGSSCHLKGSRQVVEGLKKLIDENKLADKVELSGTFCMGKCEQGVCVTVDGELCSVIVRVQVNGRRNIGYSLPKHIHDRYRQKIFGC